MDNLTRSWLAAGVANALTSSLLHPLDVAKTRLQVNGGSLLSTLRAMAGGGARGLWGPGLAPSVLRELLYSGPRVGFYAPVRDLLVAASGSDGAAARVGAALATGATACVAANPIDVIKVRAMIAAPPLPIAAAVAAVAREGGARGFFRGLAPSTLRGACITVGQVASYDVAKRTLRERLGFAEGAPLHVAGALASGAAAAACAAPFDFLKSRAMAREGAAGASMRGTLAALSREGALPGALFRGLLPAYLRQGPHMLITLPLMEQLRLALGLATI
jgi:dicarboxylate transporter 10